MPPKLGGLNHRELEAISKIVDYFWFERDQEVGDRIWREVEMLRKYLGTNGYAEPEPAFEMPEQQSECSRRAEPPRSGAGPERPGQLLILYCVQLLIRRRQTAASPGFDAVLRTRATRAPSM